MKRIAALVVCGLIPSLTLFSQDRPQSFQVFRIRDGFRVVADDGRSIEAIAAGIEVVKDSTRVVRLKGSVHMRLDGVDLYADEVVYHWDTGECEP